MHTFLLFLALAFLFGTSRASQCACATSDLNLRSGPGTSYDVIATLTSQHCLPHGGQQWAGGSYTWLRLNYHGQSVWAASNWLAVRECSSTNHPVRSTNSDVQLPGCPRIVTRAEWGARAPSPGIGTMPDLPIYVFVHHGATDPCFDEESCKSKVRAYQNYHMDSHGWSDIGYNFVVGEDGNAYEARGWTAVGAHTRGYNSNGIAICIIGNFNDRLPNNASLTTVRQLIQCGLDNGKINPAYTLKGHRDVGNTECPGTMLYQLIQGWAHYVSGTGLFVPDSLVG